MLNFPLIRRHPRTIRQGVGWWAVQNFPGSTELAKGSQGYPPSTGSRYHILKISSAGHRRDIVRPLLLCPWVVVGKNFFYHSALPDKRASSLKACVLRRVQRMTDLQTKWERLLKSSSRHAFSAECF